MFKLKRTKICLIAASTWRPPLFDIPIFWKNSCWDSIKIWCKNLYSGREGRTEFILFLASGYHLVSTNLTEILYNSGSNPGEECLRKGTWHEISIEDHEEKKLNELMKPQKILHQYLLVIPQPSHDSDPLPQSPFNIHLPLSVHTSNLINPIFLKILWPNTENYQIFKGS